MVVHDLVRSPLSVHGTAALVSALTDYETKPLDIHAVHLSCQQQSLPLKLLLEFLAERCGGELAMWVRLMRSASVG